MVSPFLSAPLPANSTAHASLCGVNTTSMILDHRTRSHMQLDCLTKPIAG